MFERPVESRPPKENRPSLRTAAPIAAPIEPEARRLAAALTAIRRRRWVLLVCALLFPALAFVAAWLATPRYTATATVLLESAQAALPGLDGAPQDATMEAILASQAELVRSLSVARRIVRQLDLTRNLEFAWWMEPAPQSGGAWRRWTAGLARRLGTISPMLAGWIGTPAPAPRPAEERAELAAAEAVRDRLQAAPVPHARVLRLGFSSEDPRLAMEGANLAAELHIGDQRELKFVALRQASDWLDSRAAQLRQDIARTEARIAELRAALAGRGAPALAAEQAALEREAEANRSLLRAVTERAQKAPSEAAIERPDARLLSPATLPGAPSSPRTLLLVLAAAACGIGFGLLLIWLLETMDGTLRSGEDVRAGLGLPCLALVPMLRRHLLGRHLVEDYVVRKPLSPFAESMRALRAALWLGSEPPRVVVVTAARPGEGKTVTAVSLARSAAMNGERVLLVDCDVRQPSLGRVFRCEGAPGVTDLLLGQAVLERIIRRDHLSSLDYIPAGAAEIHSLGLFMSEAMVGMLDRVRRDYDLVVLDAPPALAMADARVVARLADATLICIRWGDTPQSVVSRSLDLLEEAHARIVGAALTQVDARAHGRSGSADAELYHPRYSGYFRE
ncbi:polysaccharide biosynthesis tyrosine autokinase [Roseicella sp. DB1501]|uniref:polysaccharide biosynthesis tyrosine autokinase n=1 Tax=Roseicella sp. DB1501 TaxID=2730925 RepID=UPI001490D09D|nr:polysaccharide biosynthesis tyrosine autokinase [Roseicella sp. DB1501]NOG69624.1 polysaccharide biosynthesis tyrosine autokinase [Roseicella sp. DB1501]